MLWGKNWPSFQYASVFNDHRRSCAYTVFFFFYDILFFRTVDVEVMGNRIHYDWSERCVFSFQFSSLQIQVVNKEEQYINSAPVCAILFSLFASTAAAAADILFPLSSPLSLAATTVMRVLHSHTWGRRSHLEKAFDVWPWRLVHKTMQQLELPRHCSKQHVSNSCLLLINKDNCFTYAFFKKIVCFFVWWLFCTFYFFICFPSFSFFFLTSVSTNLFFFSFSIWTVNSCRWSFHVVY